MPAVPKLSPLMTTDAAALSPGLRRPMSTMPLGAANGYPCADSPTFMLVELTNGLTSEAAKPA